LLLTAGGRDGEITGQMKGQSLYYSSLDDYEYLRALAETGCRCLFMERDRYPEEHLVIIAAKPKAASGDEA